jgi:hypothetical protein
VIETGQKFLDLNYRRQGGDQCRVFTNIVMDLVTCNKHFLVDVFKNVFVFKFDIAFLSFISESDSKLLMIMYGFASLQHKGEMEIKFHNIKPIFFSSRQFLFSSLYLSF